MRDGPRVIGSRVLLALVVSVTAGPSCSSDESAGCDWEPGAHTVEVDGVQRRYEVTVEDPDGPVVLSLHGALGNPEAFEASTGVAAASRGVVITPAAHGLWWRHRDEQSADVDFLGGLLCGDDVHAVGFSSGGMMALRLACDGLVASAVVVDGMVDLEPCDEHPPVLAIHGTRDDTVGWDGRMDPEVVALVGYRRGPTVPELVEAWGPAELITHDGGHVWPDEATAEAWDYIDDH
jgi:poly(3-hydroxybutyrate) depolymerase